MRRIGLYGGSFDPVHWGHLLVAQAACEELDLDRLCFIPAAQSPFKPLRSPTPAAERLRLLRLALAGKCKYVIDDLELKRGGLSYTIDTVTAYRERYPQAELFYLVGADHVAQLSKWRAADQLAQAVSFVVIPRPGEVPKAAPPSFRIQWLKGFPIGVSSSQIRERVRAGLPIDHLTPPPVVEAIHNSALYL